MTVSDFYSKYASDTSAGSASQVEARFDSIVTRTGTYRYRLTNGGESYALLFTNVIDSTFADGSITKAGDVCGDWDILSLRAGIAPDYDSEPDDMVDVTIDGQTTYRVSGAVNFATDEIPLHASKGDYLVYEITVRGRAFPYHHEIVLKSKVTENGETVGDNRIPVPVCIASSRPVNKRIGFIGDSITQGCGTVYDSYTHWVGVIAERISPEYSVWDLGIGYARGYDAATCGTWLERASHCDIVNVCFGVNDLFHDRNADDITNDLKKITDYLHAHGCEVILFTVPPFDMQGEIKDEWYKANRIIRNELRNCADDIFDFAAVLSQPYPNEHLSIHGGHPDAEGCLKAGAAYMQKYFATKEGSAEELFTSIGEPFAAGLFEQPDSAYFDRYCAAYSRHYDAMKPAEYHGELLYPCGTGFFRTSAAVVPQYASTYIWNAEVLEKKSPLAKKIFGDFTRLSHSPGGWTHGAPNYARIIKEGLNSFRARLDAQEYSPFKFSMLRFISSIENWLKRSVEYLKSAGAPEKLVSALEHVPFEPARNMYEGLVAWNLILYIDGVDNFGMLDYGLDHLIDGEDYTDVIAQMFDNIEACDRWSCTIGGVVYNDITEQAIKAVRGNSRPLLELRVREDMPDKFWNLAAENIRMGCSNPAFYNEKGIHDMLKNRFPDIPEDDLKLFCGCGCTETNFMGLTRAGGTDNCVNIIAIFDRCMNESLASCVSFEEFYEIVCDAVEKETNLQLDAVEYNYRFMSEYLPNPPRTLLFDDCIDKRLDFNAGGARYTWTQGSDAGLINTIDSLLAVKDLIFDRKILTAEEFLEKLHSEDEAFYKILNTCPCFGVDNDEADNLAKRFTERAYMVYRNRKPKYFIDASILTEHQFTRYSYLGIGVGPTPDGRHRDDSTCDSIASLRGKALEGPTAMMKSASKLPQNLAEGISVLNLTINKDFIDSSLVSLVKSYFALGGIQVQVTATSEEELNDAMEHPERHGDMVVRVGGYSDYWKNLSPALRKAVWERNVHKL